MWFIWELHNGQLRANSDARSLRRTLRRPQNLRRAQSWVRQYATISSLSSLSFFWVEEAQEAFKNFRKEKAFQIVLQPNFPARSYDKQITFPKAIRVEIGMLKKALYSILFSFQIALLKVIKGTFLLFSRRWSYFASCVWNIVCCRRKVINIRRDFPLWGAAVAQALATCAEFH